uniref:Ribosome biogenesis protein bms1-like n=1 Tax=Dermatophagoides pteronyssinus TaxID=6956 RepID=A0A6P6YDA0_DERPT|nr:ribosome biogenesis protein bms1-like [Dermatophagoides pteronyssinus]
MTLDLAPKAHNKQSKGGKAKKKQTAIERHNPKAFTFSGGPQSVHRRVQRTAEIEQKRACYSHATDKTETSDAPPVIVVVQGPPGCGKTTLIKSLIKYYTKRSVNQLNGPVTLVVSKTRRITLIECSTEIEATLDLAKIADIALCMIDIRNGIQKDTLEFINIMKVHGFPKILGVLSFVDTFKQDKKLKLLKKKIKQRFWADLYDGAVLFYLRGMKEALYQYRDILNLCRFISVQKCEPLVWRSNHSYLLALNMTIEEANEDSCDVDFYGYLKGCLLRSHQYVTIPGFGEFNVSAVTKVPDPCEIRIINQDETEDAKPTAKAIVKQRNIYAPSCLIGQIEVQDDAIYITDYKKKEPAVKKTVVHSENVDQKKSDDESNFWNISDEEEEFSQKEDLENEPKDSAFQKTYESWNNRPDMSLEQFDYNLSDEDNSQAEVSDKEMPDTETELDSALSYISKEINFMQTTNLTKIIYSDQVFDYFDQLETVKENKPKLLSKYLSKNRHLFNINESSIRPVSEVANRLQEIDSLYETDACDVITSLEDKIENDLKTSDEDAKESFSENLSEDETSDDEGDDAGLVCDQTNDTDTLSENESQNDNDNYEVKISLDTTYKVNSLSFSIKTLKVVKKAFFATGEFDYNMQSERMKDFEAVCKQIDETLFKMRTVDPLFAECLPIPVGSYVKIRVKGISRKCIEAYRNHTHSVKPIVIGGLNANETSLTFLKCKIIRHRWAPKVLNSTEPLLFSVGWHRYQSLPYFAIEDRNSVRIRYLKYTPLYLHCLMYINGFAVPPNTGILAMKYFSRSYVDWRISLTGSVLACEPNPSIKKKLKLIGDVSKIHINTAFIINMFQSSFEVNRFRFAKIQTTSGIRGVIKKAKGEDGEFRATFEAKIQPNDTIICKTWVDVPLTAFCHPMIDTPSWDRLHTFVEIRNELKLARNKSLIDAHAYKSRDEAPKLKLPKLKIPASLVEQLPYKSMPKPLLPGSLDERNKSTEQATSEYDKLISTLLNKAKHDKKDKERKKKEKLEQKLKKAEQQNKHNLSLSQNKNGISQKDAKRLHHAYKGFEKKQALKRMKLIDE